MANIYLVERPESDPGFDYDQYSSMVVLAETESGARQVHPSVFYVWNDETKAWHFRYEDGRIDEEQASCTNGWTRKIEDLRVTYVGEQREEINPLKGVICSSFHAG
jgi:hypothetical protein